jgi:hypothetical protein
MSLEIAECRASPIRAGPVGRYPRLRGFEWLINDMGVGKVPP